MDSQSQNTRRAAVLVERVGKLPDDVVDSRELVWLGELEQRLAAVRAWRGVKSTSRQAADHAARPRHKRSFN